MFFLPFDSNIHSVFVLYSMPLTPDTKACFNSINCRRKQLPSSDIQASQTEPNIVRIVMMTLSWVDPHDIEVHETYQYKFLEHL